MSSLVSKRERKDSEEVRGHALKKFPEVRGHALKKVRENVTWQPAEVIVPL